MPHRSWSWPYLVSFGLEWLWALAGIACLAAAVIFLLRPQSLAKAEQKLARLEKSRYGRRVPFLVLGIAVPAITALFKLAQYSDFELPASSSSLIVNALWNFTHGFGPTEYIHDMYSGLSILSQHLNGTVLLLSPLFWVWPSAIVPVIAHGIAIGSVPAACYLLAVEQTRRPLLGWFAAALAFSNPLFHTCLQCTLTSCIYELPLVLWTAYFFSAGKTIPAVLSSMALLTAWENVPFVAFGVGLYLLFLRPRRSRQWGAALLIGAPLIWLAELAFLESTRSQGPVLTASWQGFYQPLGGSLRGVLHTALVRPWLFVWYLIYPLPKLLIVGKTLLQVVLLPLAAGPAAFPLLIAWIPQQLAGSQDAFHNLLGHYAAFIAGPLLWASIAGMSRVFHGRLKPNMTACLILTGIAIDFLVCDTKLTPGLMPSSWQTAVPKAEDHIPQDAKVWCETFISPRFAARRYIHLLPLGGPFNMDSFTPDRVILSMYWVARAEPQLRQSVVSYLVRKKYLQIFQEGDLVVFARPDAPPKGASFE